MSAQLHRKFHEQGGICFYCERPCWLPGSGERHWSISGRLGILLPKIRKAHKEREKRRATREHLVRKVDGGSDRSENIVMACKGCNTSRGEATVRDHNRARLAAYGPSQMKAVS